MTEIKCKVCTADTTLLFVVNTYQLYKCQSCGFIFVYPDPDNLTIEHHYAVNYYANEARYHQINNGEFRLWNHRIQKVEKLLPSEIKDSKNILDIGCATGIFLKAAQNSGWDIYGIEHSEYAARQAKDRLGTGENIYYGNFQGFQSEKTFLAVSAWDVIEHVINPLFFLEKVHSLLQDNGIFVFSTVNTSSLNHQLFGQNWRYYSPPEHLSYFNLRNLTRMLNQTGYELLKIRTIFSYQAFVDGINQRQRLSLKPNKLIKSFLFPLKMISEWFGQGDIVEIWTKKLPSRQP
jgi:2-polyprenyl-3-methyl-5-hydroxy-6-metoxy-1,4-benzoquinol methylase